MHVVAYIDVLGLREAMITSRQNKVAAEAILASYADALDAGLDELLPNRGDTQPLKDDWKYRIFTDSIVLARERWSNDLESELGDAIDRICDFQAQLAKHGWIIRGGVTIGDLYMDTEVCFGGALVRAYELESKQARDPRVIIDKDLLPLIQRHLTYYAMPYKSPQNGFILVDTDDIPFLNYLYAFRGLLDDIRVIEPAERALLTSHRKLIVSKLAEFKGMPLVWAKYRWLAAYHNFFCETWARHAIDQIVGPSDLATAPHLLVPQ